MRVVLEVNAQAGYLYQGYALADDEGRSSLTKWPCKKKEKAI